MEQEELAAEYSRRALARLAFSVAAAELSNRARSRVPTADDSWARPGELLDEARALVAAAEELVGRAIVYERECGSSWTVLGEVMGVSKQGAQQKYGTLAEDWATAVDQVVQPVDGRLTAACLPGEGSDSPHEHAQRLDAWVLQHAEKQNRPRGKNPVSDGLERMNLIQQMSAFARLARRMNDEKDPVKLRAFQECKQALLTRVAEADPGNIEAASAAESARRELAALSIKTGAAGQPSKPRKLRLVPKSTDR
jgi:hypothetical protein